MVEEILRKLSELEDLYSKENGTHEKNGKTEKSKNKEHGDELEKEDGEIPKDNFSISITLALFDKEKDINLDDTEN